MAVIASRESGRQDVDDERREENYLIKKAFTAMGAVQIENQARI